MYIYWVAWLCLRRLRFVLYRIRDWKPSTARSVYSRWQCVSPQELVNYPVWELRKSKPTASFFNKRLSSARQVVGRAFGDVFVDCRIPFTQFYRNLPNAFGWEHHAQLVYHEWWWCWRIHHWRTGSEWLAMW